MNSVDHEAEALRFAAEVLRLNDVLEALEDLADEIESEAEAKESTGNWMMGEYHRSFADRIRAALEGSDK